MWAAHSDHFTHTDIDSDALRTRHRQFCSRLNVLYSKTKHQAEGCAALCVSVSFEQPSPDLSSWDTCKSNGSKFGRKGQTVKLHLSLIAKESDIFFLRLQSEHSMGLSTEKLNQGALSAWFFLTGWVKEGVLWKINIPSLKTYLQSSFESFIYVWEIL